MDTTMIVILVAVALGFIITFVIYNAITQNYNLVQRAWSDVMTQERQKGRILPELERVLASHKDYESSILPKIVALRSGIDTLSDKSVDTQKLAELNQVHQELMTSLRVQVEAYPELGTNTSFNKLMKEITNQEDNVGAAVRIFNRNVEIFNSSIQVFPNNLVNSIFNKKNAIKTFSDSKAAAEFEYKPNF